MPIARDGGITMIADDSDVTSRTNAGQANGATVIADVERHDE